MCPSLGEHYRQPRANVAANAKDEYEFILEETAHGWDQNSIKV